MSKTISDKYKNTTLKEDEFNQIKLVFEASGGKLTDNQLGTVLSRSPALLQILRKCSTFADYKQYKKDVLEKRRKREAERLKQTPEAVQTMMKELMEKPSTETVTEPSVNEALLAELQRLHRDNKTIEAIMVELLRAVQALTVQPKKRGLFATKDVESN